MKKFVLASVSALALLTVAACSDSKDNTTTQSVPAPATEQMAPATPEAAPADPATETGTGGAMNNTPTQPAPMEPAPASPAPAQ